MLNDPTEPTDHSNVRGKRSSSPRPVPGLVLICESGQPACRVLTVDSNGEPLELGRLLFVNGDQPPSKVSRRHARVTWSGTRFCVVDLGSRNGTFVGGKLVGGQTPLETGALLRVGDLLLLATENVVPYWEGGVQVVGGIVRGPHLRRALEAIEATQLIGQLQSVFVRGETGSGKELAARAFHNAGRAPKAPFVAINCATIVKELAERLLFGSTRGAYSGATDTPGQLQAANGGTLFLDEVAELPFDVQGKLLRVLETREVLRLGALRSEAVDVRICAASWRDLRAAAAAGVFRKDLYFRIGQPEIQLPALRERIEELPWHIQQIVAEVAESAALRACTGFVEAIALRTWPGNVRELRAEVRRAAAAALARHSTTLERDDLSPTAGHPLEAEPIESEFPTDEIAAALREAQGNVSEAARRLGLHRNRIRRWLERHSVEAGNFKR